MSHRASSENDIRPGASIAPAFTEHTIESAPAAARRFMTATQNHLGYLPAPLARMAASPQLLDGFLRLTAIFESCTLHPGGPRGDDHDGRHAKRLPYLRGHAHGQADSPRRQARPHCRVAGRRSAPYRRAPRSDPGGSPCRSWTPQATSATSSAGLPDPRLHHCERARDRARNRHLPYATWPTGLPARPSTTSWPPMPGWVTRRRRCPGPGPRRCRR